MSEFDDLRKSFGVTPVSSGGNNSKSEFDDLRMSFGLIPDNRPKPVAPEPPVVRDGINLIPTGQFRPLDQSPIVQQAQQYAADHPQPKRGGIPLLDTINEGLGNLSDKFMRSAVSGIDALLPGDQRSLLQKSPLFKEAARPAETTGEKIADLAGSLYGATPAVLGAYGTGGKLAEIGLSKLAPNAPKLLTNLVRGAGAGIAYGTGEEALQAAQGEQQNLGGRLKDIGLDAALFAGGDAALGLVGKGISQMTKFGNNTAANLAENAIRNVGDNSRSRVLSPFSEGLSPSNPIAEAYTKSVSKTFDPKLRTLETGKPNTILGEASQEAQTIPKAMDSGEGNAADPFQSFDARELKDISGFAAQTRDIYRNLEASLGKENAKTYLEPFNKAKKDNVDMQEYWLNELKTNVVDKLGIQKGSKLSGLVQKYGEKQISLDELKQQAPKDWEKVVEADDWFRKSYDHLIDIVNESRSKIYPNNPDKIVPKRDDYYRHFRELNGLEGLKNLFDTPAAIDPSLAGISEFTKPQSKFAGFMQKRGMGPFKNDAVGGFLNYIPSATYATHIDPQVEVWRSLSQGIAANTRETRNMNHLVEFLHDYANDLAGKTNGLDRYVQKIIPGGRKTMGAIQWLNNRVKANTILGNIGSTLAQTANIPNGIAFAKQYSVKGAGETLAAALGKNTTPMSESGFLKERFSGEMYRKFNTKWIDQPANFASWLMETADRTGTYFVWNSAYTKGVAQEVADPVAYADDATRKLVAGRGIGEVPLLQKAKVTQFVAPFQLEVANLWRVMGDFVKEKDFGALAILFVGNYLFNRGMEQIKGSGVTFDPIQALIEATKEGLSPTERAGRLGGEILSNLPGGQLAATFYPEYGTDNLPTRKKLFGDNDPTRFGNGLLAVKGMQDPMYKLALPFGGNQLKKTIQGIDSIKKGGAYQGDALKYPIDQSPINIGKQILFGPNATQEAQTYFKQERRPLSADQTKMVQMSGDKQTYNKIQQQRKLDSLESAIMKVDKNITLSDLEKWKKINPLIEQYKKLQGG